jgi:drug/metabolite transporter (DMT)-like permease
VRSSRTDLALGATATLSLGVPFLLIAVAQRAMSTPVMAAARVALAAAALLLVLVGRGPGTLGHVRAALTRHPVALTVVGLTAAVAPNLLIGSAERHVPSGTVAVLLATTPLWIAVGAELTRSGERFGTRQWVAAPLALAGVGWASRAATPADALAWCALPLAAAVSYAVANLVLRRHLADVSALVVTTAEMVVASVVLVPIAAAHPGPVRWQPVAWAALAVVGIGCSGLGWLANTALVQRVGASRASVVSYTSVVVSVLLGALVLGEPLTAQVLTGTAVLVAAVAVFAWPRTPSRVPRPASAESGRLPR